MITVTFSNNLMKDSVINTINIASEFVQKRTEFGENLQITILHNLEVLCRSNSQKICGYLT